MPRQSLDIGWQHRIAELMQNEEELSNSPTKLTNQLKLEPSPHDAPALRTVERYMQLIRLSKMPLLAQRKRFEWPRDMGHDEDQVPWEFSRHTLDCLGFYLENHDNRPAIGLVLRFARIAASSPGWSDQQRAIMAEQIWYADLVEATPGRKRPSTAYEELRLSTKAWERKDPSFLPDLAKKLGIKQLVVPKSDLRFVSYMPEFQKVFKQWSPEDSEKLIKPGTEKEANYLRRQSLRKKYLSAVTQYKEGRHNE